jgi:putative ABC transport system substrate-binding protein
VAATDPVGKGFVASLAHPGGNVTGVTDTVGMAIEGKRLQLLKEAVPMVSRVAVLDRLSGPPEPLFQREREAAATTLGLTLEFYSVRGPADFARTFAAMTEVRAEALLVIPSSSATIHAQRIVDLATQRRLPVVSDRYFIPAGALLSYDANLPDIWRRAGFYVDKILKGANPGDLPVEQPTKFELLINLKSAKALGLTIPQSLLSRADEVIQ